MPLGTLFGAVQPSPAAALAGAMGGALFEGLLVSEAYKVFALQGRRPDLYFWRSRDGLEVDLVLRLPGGLVPIEIKLTATPTPRHLDVLDRWKALAGRAAASTGVLVCRVAQRTALPSHNLALPWHHFPGWLSESLGEA